MANLTLYEINENLQALTDSLDLCQTPEERAACEADIERAVAAQIRKVDDFSHFLTHLESQAEVADREIERLRTRRRRFTGLQERLQYYAVRVMQTQNLKHIDGDTTRLTLRHNPPAVEITDESLVPAEFKTIQQTIACDKRAIKSAIDAGEEVPGAHLRPGTVSLLRR